MEECIKGQPDPRDEWEQTLTGDGRDGKCKVIDAYEQVSRVHSSRMRESYSENFCFLSELRNKVTKKHEV